MVCFVYIAAGESSTGGPVRTARRLDIVKAVCLALVSRCENCIRGFDHLFEAYD